MLKMIEKSIQDQTQNYLQRKEMLYSTYHSTDIYFPQLTEMILNGADNGKHTSMISINLQQVFDTFYHKTFCRKN